MGTVRDFSIERLFRKYDQELDHEYDWDNYLEYFQRERRDGGNVVLQSLQLIEGEGAITNSLDWGYSVKDNNYKYVELLNDDALKLIVYADWSRPITSCGLSYEVGLYRNYYTQHQIGGGYGASGIIVRTSPTIDRYSCGQWLVYNKHTISRVVADIKAYALTI